MRCRRSRQGILNGPDRCTEGGTECLGNGWGAGGVCCAEEKGLGGSLESDKRAVLLRRGWEESLRINALLLLMGFT